MNTAVDQLVQEVADKQNKEGKYYIKDAVKLPDLEDRNEWIANNIFYFHKQICMLYGTVSDECTPQSCPQMTASKRYEYIWSYGPDNQTSKTCAADYIVRLLDWVQELLNDEEIFPSRSVDKEFPPNFETICQTIARRLFRVYAHVYHHHLSRVRYLRVDAHMNTSLKHFIYFVKEFDLVTENELEPLKDCIEKLK